MNQEKLSILIIKIIVAIFLGCIVITALQQCYMAEVREESNLVSISEGLVYDAETLIVYKETTLTNFRHSPTIIYTVYYDENANMCQYIDGEIVPME